VQSLNILPRADNFSLTNEHEIYRKYRVPGLRESKEYRGTGIEKTYNMAPTDSALPPCPDAVPALLNVSIGNGNEMSVMRKSVAHDTVLCPECETECVVEGFETFCPECCVVVTEPSEEFIRTPEAAGRYIHG